jgi:DNA-3-methyladenine glycosylase
VELVARDFLARPSWEVAPDLLGCVLEHETAEGVVSVELTEVEAYAGELDPASHAYRGRTARNAVMYGPPGYAYVYFTYGMHFCANVICMPVGTANGILLRAGRVIAGAELARERRALRRPGRGQPPEPDPVRVIRARDLARGPARLCQAMAIDRAQNGADLCDPESPLRLRRMAGDVRQDEPLQISAGPRVGVSAGADTNWRFWLANDPTVSVYRPYKPRTSHATR